MQHCLQPYVPYQKAMHTMTDAVMGKVLRSEVACGRCAACVANRKQDWTGRLLAEGATSASMAFVTLTYANDADGNAPDRFAYEHIQAMLKRFRIHLWRKHETTLRFFCVGERGDLYGRRHWHMLFFFDRPYNMERPAENTKWAFWPHGWMTCEMLPEGERRVKKTRYCVMYCLKDAGAADGERARMSLMPAIGSRYLSQQGAAVAEAGLVPDGKYRMQGVRWSTGRKEGELVNFTLQGAVRRDYIAAWRHAWSVRYPDRQHPVNDWLLRYDDEAIAVHRSKAKALRDKTKPKPYSERPWVPRYSCQPRSMVIGETGANGRGWFVELSLTSDGRARVFSEHHSMLWEAIEIDRSISEALDLPAWRVERIDTLLRKWRGPQWRDRSYNVEQEEEREQERRYARARFRENLSEHTDDSIRRLRARHGTAPGIGGIYDRSWSAERQDEGRYFDEDTARHFVAPCHVPF